MEIEEKVLRSIKPGPDEEKRIKEAVDALSAKIEEMIGEYAVDAEPVLVGSIAKGTNLKGSDIDLFIGFSPDIPVDEMERVGIEIGMRSVKGKESYASHPYVRGEFMGFEVDVVPCYRTGNGSSKMSAVDRTPFHTEYIKNHMRDAQRDEVRLLKRFMKGIGVYGAEAEIEGFSGYLTELLILYYGSFREVLEGSQGWKRGIRLRLEDEPGNRFDEPLIFIDPVDPKRNVASALSIDSFSLFIYAAHEYLRSPDMRFFFPADRRAESGERISAEIRRRGTHIIGLRIERPELVPDVLFPQIKKTRRVLCGRFSDRGFPVLSSAYRAEESSIFFAFELETGELPAVMNHYGPPVWNSQSENFLRKWRDMPRRIENGRWVMEIPREPRDAAAYLKMAVADANLGKNLNVVKDSGYEILEEKELIERCPAMLTELLFPLFSWEAPEY